MNIEKIIGNNIAYYRKLKGITQKDLASALFVSPSTVQKWEVAKNNMQLKDYIQICKVLGVGLEELTMDRENGLLTFYHRQAEVCAYDNTYKESVEYIGVDKVVSGLLKYQKEAYDSSDIDKEKDLDEEKRRIAFWEEENSYFIAVNIEFGEIYGLRDYGRYRPFASDVLFQSKLLPVSLINQPFYLGEETKMPKKTEEDWIEDWKKEINEKAAYLKEAFEREVERYKSEAEEGKINLFIISNTGLGMCDAYDLINEKYYMIEKFSSDESSFYIRGDENINSFSEIENLCFPMSKKADHSFRLFFPDKQLMHTMGLFDIPGSFEEMESREDFTYETTKKVSIEAPQKDELYDSIINLLNIYPIEGRTCNEYKELKSYYENITSLLLDGTDVKEELWEELEFVFKEAYEAMWTKDF